MAEHVILFAGPMGSGKTTAIRTLSDIEVLATEAVNTERNVVDKPSTTVALDYGEIGLGDEEKVRLYGIPGQRRFDFMWSILRERAHGLVLLVNNDAPDPIGAMNEFLDEFGDVLARGGVVVGVSRADVSARPTVADYATAIARRADTSPIPIFSVDARSAGHMRLLLMTLIVNIEMRSAFAQQQGS